MLQSVLRLSLALVYALAIAYAAEEGPVIFGRNDAEGKGVVLLDAFTFDRVIDHVKGARFVIGFFNKKDSRRRLDPKEEFSAESRSRENYLGFALHAIKDLEADAQDIIFAQVLVNGKNLFVNYHISDFHYWCSTCRRRKCWAGKALWDHLVPRLRASAGRWVFCPYGSKR